MIEVTDNGAGIPDTVARSGLAEPHRPSRRRWRVLQGDHGTGGRDQVPLDCAAGARTLTDAARQVRPGSVVGLVPDDNDRDQRGGNQVLAGRSEQQPGDAAAAAAADHNQLRFLSGRQSLGVATAGRRVDRSSRSVER